LQVYADQVDEKGDPSPEWWAWMKAGIAQDKVNRRGEKRRKEEKTSNCMCH
jgi:hypothetical protein